MVLSVLLKTFAIPTANKLLLVLCFQSQLLLKQGIASFYSIQFTRFITPFPRLPIDLYPRPVTAPK
jgi:hypothetical protein